MGVLGYTFKNSIPVIHVLRGDWNDVGPIYRFVSIYAWIASFADIIVPNV